jgi:hypothetical protein
MKRLQLLKKTIPDSCENHFRAHAGWSRASMGSDNGNSNIKTATALRPLWSKSKSVWLGETMSRFAAV